MERVGIRFTTLVGFTGSRIAVPNRTITNVVSYPDGYVRVFVDVMLPDDGPDADGAEAEVRRLAEAAYEQFPGVMLRAPAVVGRLETAAGRWMRLKFGVWPGQGGVVETMLKPRIVRALGQTAPGYADWMVAVHYRSEPSDDASGPRLPRPAVLRRRQPGS